jgi:hypothetical protein
LILTSDLIRSYPVKKAFQDFVRDFRAFRGQITDLSDFIRVEKPSGIYL